MVQLAVEGVGNRAGDNSEGVAFGYVYFNDESRVGFSNSAGVFPGNWQGTGRPNTRQHAALAVAALKERGLLDAGVTLKADSWGLVTL